jgi:hypothetical protein
VRRRGSAPVDVDGDGMAGTQVTVMLMHVVLSCAAHCTTLQTCQQSSHPRLAHTTCGHRLHPRTQILHPPTAHRSHHHARSQPHQLSPGALSTGALRGRGEAAASQRGVRARHH